MKIQIMVFCSMSLLLLSSGCSRKKEIMEYGDVKISPAITRVEGLYFESGDRIGLSIIRASGIYAGNVQMTYDGSLFRAQGLKWYDGEEVSILAAYYPYAGAGVPSEVSVGVDQTSGYEAYDLLAARKSDVAPSSSAVGMVFRHMMALLKITITNNTLSPVVEVIVEGTIPNAQFDLAAQSISSRGTAASPIKAYAVTPGQLFQAVLVPQQAALVLAVKCADGKIRTASFASNSFLQGKLYTVDLVVEADTLIPTLSGEVSDWEVGGGLKPDGGNSEQEPGGDQEPTDGTMICQGESYKTVTVGGLVWMAENLHYIPAGMKSATGVWYPDGNSDYLKTYGMLYDRPQALALCPEGWRIPTEEDFKILIPLFDAAFPSSVPIAGTYSAARELFSGVGLNGYLMGATAGSRENCYKHCSLVKGSVPEINENYPGENGVSVRFVKDEK